MAEHLTPNTPSRPLLSPTEREIYGRLVREVWVACAKERGEAAPAHHLLDWDQLDPWNQEVDCRIGETVALAAQTYARLPRPYRELRDERLKQDAQWGGPAHDDTHSRYDWLGLVREFLRRAESVVYGAKGDAQYRRSLVKAGALIVAALEAEDRKMPMPSDGPAPG